MVTKSDSINIIPTEGSKKNQKHAATGILAIAMLSFSTIGVQAKGRGRATARARAHLREADSNNNGL